MRSLEPGQRFAGDFVIERSLDGGGMGSIYVATQTSTGKRRALKLMHPELTADAVLRQRFEQEARIGARIASDHVVQVIAAGVDDASGAPWLAMELLEGEHLGAYVARRGALPLTEVREIVAQLVHAIAAAHAVGVVHRDLKPENVFMARARTEGAPRLVKVLDFGIAKIVAGTRAAGTAPMGTLAWMAPEQTDERGDIGPAADIWALGLIVFTLIVGASFWPLDAPLSILVRKLLLEPIPLASERARDLQSDVRPSAGFDAWFARCVARAPADRFLDVGIARAELGRVLDEVEASLARAPTQAASSLRELTGGAVAVLPPARWKVPIEGSPMRGGVEPLVTIVEFADFECPFSVVIQDSLREMLAAFGDDVAIAWKDMPYDAHPAAHGAARFARFARAEEGDAMFWKAHDALFSSCASRGLSEIDGIARTLGIDPERAARAIAGPDHPDTLRDTELGLDFRARIIPAFFVNGVMVVGPRAIGNLRSIVEAELETARALVAEGLPRARVYDELTRDAAKSPAPAKRVFLLEPHRHPKLVGARARIDVHRFADRTSMFMSAVEPIVQRFVRQYSDVLRYHFHDVVDFDDPKSVDVGVAARAALDVGGDAGYWRLHEILLENGPRFPESQATGRLDRAMLFEHAKHAGLHAAYFRMSFDSPDRRVELARSRDAATEAGIVPGDPATLLVGGYRANGLIYRSIEKALERALEELG